MYVLGIDQSTQGTKAILVDKFGKIIGRADRPHEQIVDEKGWVSHNLEEIYHNVILTVQDVVKKTGIDKKEIETVGISNQRETSAIWDRDGHALNYAVVWQCSRSKEIVAKLQQHGEEIRKKTGINLSAFFPAGKFAWLLQNTQTGNASTKDICLGTIDSWLIYRLTGGKSFKTDYSNASRTQLFNIHSLEWDQEICDWFGIPVECLPKVCDSNADFGETDLDGFLTKKIPIRCVLGDSHAALYGQECHKKGMIKTTYGTGSSIMMNIGSEYAASNNGLVTSLAWGIDGKISYVLEGNINYTGAVITWLKDDMKLIEGPGETEEEAFAANEDDATILIPAFSGLSAPYWKDNAKALVYGMTRTTGKNEFVRAGLDSIAFQIQAVLSAMEKDSLVQVQELRVDGGPTRNKYLMQIQSDLCDVTVAISGVEELSALGVAYLAGISKGIFDKEKVFSGIERVYYQPKMDSSKRQSKIKNWNKAIKMVMNSEEE